MHRNQLESIVLLNTRAHSIKETELIQNLWSGYGEILRVWLDGYEKESIVVKHVKIPIEANHPRGWNTDIGHQRKLKSYEVETAWYRNFAKDSKARVPNCIAIDQVGEETVILMEDLNASGFNLRKTEITWPEVEACIAWLAQFHASFIDRIPNGLWPIGTYWHLDTRPNELEALQDVKLKNAAAAIDERLNRCKYKTLVHGDAKLANFCFSPSGDVAAVDFQYVGGGCGMKDLAYFVGSCFYEEDCERLEGKILDTYFTCLQKELDSPIEELESEWRDLYPFAWADFHRFIKGWSPGHWKINTYSERITAEVIQQITSSRS